jgi:hypothetical protein
MEKIIIGRLKSPFCKGGFRGILFCANLEIPPLAPPFAKGGVKIL